MIIDEYAESTKNVIDLYDFLVKFHAIFLYFIVWIM